MLLSIGFKALFNKCNSIQLILGPWYKHLKSVKPPKHHNKTLILVWLSFCFLSRHYSDQMSQASKVTIFVQNCQICPPVTVSQKVKLVTLFVGINYHCERFLGVCVGSASSLSLQYHGASLLAGLSFHSLFIKLSYFVCCGAFSWASRNQYAIST